MKFFGLFVLLLVSIQTNAFSSENFSADAYDLNKLILEVNAEECPQTCEEANCQTGWACARFFSWNCGAYYSCRKITQKTELQDNDDEQ